MAKQRYGINDAYRGTVGTVIGYEWCGRWCLRARPLRVHNPRTARQQFSRGLFAAASHLASAMGQVLRVGMRSAALEWHRTAYNHFLSVNKACFSMEGEVLNVDHEHLVVAAGLVAPVGFSSPREGIGEMSIIVPFERNPLQLSASGDDLVYLYAWCPGAEEGLLSTLAFRRTKQVSMVLPGRWQGLEVHLYGLVVDNVARASDSEYLGLVASADEVVLVAAGSEEGCCREGGQQ